MSNKKNFAKHVNENLFCYLNSYLKKKKNFQCSVTSSESIVSLNQDDWDSLWQIIFRDRTTQ